MKGERQATHTHTRSGLLVHHTHTPSMYTNINTAMYTFTWDLCPAQAPGSGWGAYRGWYGKAGTWRRARSCSPPLTAPPKHLVPPQRRRPGRGQTPVAAGVPGVSSDPPVRLSSQTLPGSLGLSLCVSRLPQGLEGGGCLCPAVSPGPSGLFPGLTGGWGCGAARRRRWCWWSALCRGRGPRHSPPQGSRAG